VVPLVAALLLVPIPEGRYPPLLLSPQQQRQETLDVLVAWLLAEAERQPVLAVWEDLHWADPSTLELLGLVIDQAPMARMLTLLTARPEFRPPWAPRSHLTQLTLGRLPHPQVETMVRQLTGEKLLPAEVLAQMLAKTDGVSLFVEELVKMILESGLVREEADRYTLTGPLPPLAIPATLQDSLMARLDRLASARAVAQLGAVLGREFAYELIWAIALIDEATLLRGLAQLVDAELLYQRGRPPQAWSFFKHALIQEAAYQALLKRAPVSSITSGVPRCWKRSFQRSSRPSPNCWRTTIPRLGSPSRPSLTGSGPGNRPASARPTWKRSSTSPEAWNYLPRSPRPRRGLSRSLIYKSPWGQR
jgi:predicted ATPase